jgi:remodeling and spacing factor 1
LSEQLIKYDTLVQNIETAELRKQRQRMMEITAQNIIEEERRKKRERSPVKREKSVESESSKSGSSDSDSSDDAPLIYKLRKRNQTSTSYRFNEYDDLINSAIKEEMEEVKGAGNLGRGKDISTIIEADKEEKRNLKREFDDEEGSAKEGEDNNDAESSGSDVIRRKKNSSKRKKKTRKLNNLDSSSDVQSDADESFKGSTPSSDSEVDEEDLSMSSVSESSLDLPRKKGSAPSRGLRTRTRQKRYDNFIDDNDSNDSDDEPLISVKRNRKKVDSDEEDFDANDDIDDDENSEVEDIDSDDLCDDTESSDSSESAWPKKKKKRNASYDQKPRKPAKKKIVEDEDKAFRAGISKKKILKQQQSENESEASEDENVKGRRTRGKKLLYLIEDDLESDESDGIRPGVKRPETPPEEREMFFKKQEEIKRMLAAKDTEAAKKLAAPTIEPINVRLERPESPTMIPYSDEPSSLSTIPMNVIESAKALDTDYNRVMKPIFSGSKISQPSQKEMNEEELAKMMEDEDFAQHQLKLAGDAIAKKKLLDFEAKEDAFAGFGKLNKEKELTTPEKQKRAKKPKVDKALEEINKTQTQSPLQMLQQQTPPVPPLMNPQIHHKPPLTIPPHPMQQQSPIMANFMQHQQQPPPQQIIQQQQPPYVPSSANMMPDRPSVLSNYMNRPLNLPPQQHMKVLQSPSPPHHQQMKPLQSPPPLQMHPKSFSPKTQQMSMQQEEDMKKARRKKSSQLEGNTPKHAKIDTPPSVIHPPMSSAGMVERLDEKGKGKLI